jgi:hypothetical protein
MNMSLTEMEKHLKALRLHGMIATLDTRIIQANQGSSFTEVFACLVQDELDYRKSRLTETRFKASGLTEQPTLTEFDWGFNPKLPKMDIYELVSGKFIRDGHDALLIGSPGTEKATSPKQSPTPLSSQATKSFTGRPTAFSRTSSKPLNLSEGKSSINSFPKPTSWSSMICSCARKARNKPPTTCWKLS